LDDTSLAVMRDEEDTTHDPGSDGKKHSEDS